MQTPQAKITQQSDGWLVSGAILVDNVNSILLESETLDFSRQYHQIDFSHVTVVDTSAISLIMEWQRRALKANTNVKFANLPANLSSLAELYGVADFIPLS